MEGRSIGFSHYSKALNLMGDKLPSRIEVVREVDSFFITLEFEKDNLPLVSEETPIMGRYIANKRYTY